MFKRNSAASKDHIWSNKNQRTMIITIVASVVICALMFCFVGLYMNKTSNNTVDNVGEMYMKNMGEQVTQRFESVMKQRLTMVEALVNDEYEDSASVEQELRDSAMLRGFEFLAFYYAENVETDGYMEPVLGQSLTITDKPPFRTSLLSGNKKIAVGSGVDEDGVTDNAVVMIGVPTDKFEMSNGKKCKALIAGVSNKDFVDMLNVNVEGEEDVAAINSYIIRKDGSYVLRNNDLSDDYFKRLETVFADTSVNVQELVTDLKDAMQDNKVYSNIMHAHDSATNTDRHVHMYCNRLDMSEWYLVSVMDNTHLDAAIASLGGQWTLMIVLSVIVTFVVFVFVCIMYLYFNRQNVEQLRKAREEALAASKAKSEFLSNMSHDIRTPMNAIVGMTAIARANIDNKQQVQDCLKKIALSSKHLLGLINDVLDMSKIESGKMTLNVEKVSLREVLDGITTIVQPQIKIKKQNFSVVVRNIQQEAVYCDSVRINQVLLNLLSNAIKFTGEEGTITVTVDQEASPVGDDYVRTHIYVKDNGIGMSPEFQKKIYDSFTREDSLRVHRTEGTGLGMSITKYIVDAMKGTIELQSELGKGTEFHIILDLEKALVPEEEMILPSWKLLIVDDDQQLCETTVESLKDIGIIADWTLDGETAVEKTVKAHDEHKKYDIILLDWKLPGIDGIETAKRIHKALGEDVPILLISAYDWSEIEEEARAAGISGFISKPLFKSTLFYGLRQFTGDAATNHSDAATGNKKIDLAGTHVLLAEDNELNWEIAETLLDSVGITCDHAENGRICVDMFKNSAPGTYKAIFMDIRMPVMTGYEATVEIRKLDHPDKDLPIIAMTADAFADDMKKCLECGMNAHIAKPIDLDLVQNTLAKFLNK